MAFYDGEEVSVVEGGLPPAAKAAIDFAAVAARLGSGLFIVSLFILRSC
jgi:hypothetical protein